MPETQKRSRKGCLKKIVITGICLLLALAVGAWFARGWIMEKALVAIDARLAEAKIYATYESPGISPIRGLVIENLRLFEDPEKTVKLLELGNIGVDISLREIFKGMNLQGTLSVSDAELSIFPADDAVRTISGLDLAIRQSGQAFVVDNCEMLVDGLLVKADGTLYLPAATDPVEPEETEATEKTAPMTALARALPGIAKTLKSLEFSGETPPQLTVQFSNEEAAPKIFNAAFALGGEAFSFGKIRFDQLATAAAWKTDGKVEIGSTRAALGGSKLEFTGSYDPKSKALQMAKIRGTLDPVRLQAALGAEVKDTLSFKTPLELESGAFEMTAGDLATAKADVTVTDGSLSVKTVNAPLEMTNLNFKAGLDENVLRLTEGSMNVMGAEARFSGDLPDMKAAKSVNAKLKLTGVALSELAKVAGMKGKMNGSLDVDYAGKFLIKESRLEIEKTALTLGATRIAATGAYDLKSKNLNLSEIEGALDPMGLAAAFGGKTDGPVSFSKPWALSGGVFKMPGGKLDAATARLTLKGAELVVKTANAPLDVKGLNVMATLAENTLVFENGSAGVFGTVAKFSGRLPSLTKPNHCELKMNVAALELSALAGVTGMSPNTAGNVDANFAGRVMFDGAPLFGKGKVKLHEAKLYSVPLFDGLFGLLKSIAPMLGNDGTKDGEGTYEIAGSALKIESASVRSESTEINAIGDLDYASGAIKFDATANFRGAVGLATGLVSKALEIQADGTMADPKWRFKNLPGIKAAMDVTGAAVRTGTAVTGAALKTGEAVTGAAMKTGEAVLDTANDLRPGIIFKKKKKAE